MENKINDLKNRALPVYLKISTEVQRLDIKNKASTDWVKGQFQRISKYIKLLSFAILCDICLQGLHQDAKCIQC